MLVGVHMGETSRLLTRDSDSAQTQLDEVECTMRRNPSRKEGTCFLILYHIQQAKPYGMLWPGKVVG